MNRTKLAAFALALALAAPFAAVAEDAPGVFKIPGTESTIKFYGYVQLDTTLDLKGRIEETEDADWAVFTPGVPLNNSIEAKRKKPQLYMTARTSRFGVQTSTPSKYGPIGVKLEGDFNAPNAFQGETFTNSMLYRVRHAYGTVGGLLVGQTWSTFCDLNSYADTVDFNGPANTTLVRNPMIRYTFDLGSGLSLAVAAENAPGTRGFGDGAPKSAFQTIPDFIAKVDYAGSWGSVSARGVTMNYKRAVTATSGAPPVTAYVDTAPLSKQGFGGALSGAFKITPSDTLVAYLAGGPGIGRYVLGSNGAVNVNAAADDLILTTAFGYHAGYTHVWTPEFRSNLVWSQTLMQNPKDNGNKIFGNNNNESVSQAFVNTFWSFAKNAEAGVEYAWGQRKTFSTPTLAAQKGDQSRINFTVHYNFF
jgi:hypothetical protein